MQHVCTRVTINPELNVLYIVSHFASHRHCDIAPRHRRQSDPTLDKVAQGFKGKSILNKMQKYTLNPNYSVLMAILSAITCIWVVCLFLQNMTYDKYAVRVANTDYVREVTRWPGHTQIVNIPVYKG